jgi:putative membrane protein
VTIRTPALRPAERRVLWATLAYVAVFTAWFLASGNLEFVVYVAQMGVAIGVLAATARAAEYPVEMLWALSLWGLMHMAGGAVRVGDGVLYSFVLVPVVAVGDTAILKYDQVVHAYGFGVSAWVLWRLAVRFYPVLRGGKPLYVFCAFAAMGLGAFAEICELMAKLIAPETNVGGYYNNAVDLVFNGVGITVALALVSRRERRLLSRRPTLASRAEPARSTPIRPDSPI